MKSTVKIFLQKLLGFDNYLFIFSLFKIYTLRWDQKENDFFHFMDMIPTEGTVLDIGANIGVMTARLAKKSRKLDIFSIEPIIFNLICLKRVVSFFKFKNIQIFDFALGHEEGKALMVVPTKRSLKMHGLSHIIHPSIIENNEGHQCEVIVRKLDNIQELRGPKIKITAIKMDVENFECFVLAGAEELIKKHKPIIYLELWENENRDKCFAWTTQMRYDIYIYQKGVLTKYNKELHKTQNFIFAPLP